MTRSTARPVAARLRGRAARGLVAVAGALVLTTSLSACDPDQLGAAAIIDGKVISTDQLQSQAQAYLRLVPDADSARVQQQILARLVISEVIANAARANDVRISTGTVADQRDEILRSTHGRKGLIQQLSTQQTPTILTPSLVDVWIHDQLLYRKLLAKFGGGDATSAEAAARGTQALKAASRRMDIKINPRYGTWNTSTGIETQLSGGLSKTPAQLAAGQ